MHHDFKGMFGLDLKDQVRLIIQPDMDEHCRDYEERIRCKSVIIIGVVDYHDQKNEWIFR